jgi:hypothetical protein
MGTMYMTTRGIWTLNPTMWNVPADIGYGLLLGASIPGGLTAGAIHDVNTVTELLAITGVDEPTDGSYARLNPITLGTAIEDDTDDRVEYPAGDGDFGALTNSTVYGLFVYLDGANDGLRLVLAVDLFTSAVVANGAGFIYRSGGTPGTADIFRNSHAAGA